MMPFAEPMGAAQGLPNAATTWKARQPIFALMDKPKKDIYKAAQKDSKEGGVATIPAVILYILMLETYVIGDTLTYKQLCIFTFTLKSLLQTYLDLYGDDQAHTPLNSDVFAGLSASALAIFGIDFSVYYNCYIEVLYCLFRQY